jgi:putative transposase
MIDDDNSTPARVRWARLRFSVIGSLLASPPEEGELYKRICELAARSWRHPTTNQLVRYSPKTIERWFYAARDEQDPIVVLERKVPKHAGTHPSITPSVAVVLRGLRKEHPTWSYQLVFDNLVALAKNDDKLHPLPGYASVRRYMKQNGLEKRRRRRRRQELGGQPDFVEKERRSFEVAHVHALWHLDFHEGRRNVLTANGEWKRPVLLGILDDHSRLCCHAQWYLAEDAQSLIHGLCQALQKRGLPRALLTDNGAAMLAAETREGLERLSITHQTTLPYTPEQNGKQESFWGPVEGRLMAMLESEERLTLDLLNLATQAWVEQEYHRQKHSEIDEPPLERALRDTSVARVCPSSDALRRAFTSELTRRQRKSDGTCTVLGVRYEVPQAYRTLNELRVRVARWDLSSIALVDPRGGQHLAMLLPLDKTKNAERRRRAIQGAPRADAEDAGATSGIAPLLKKLMAEYAATGLPPAYLTTDVVDDDEDEETQ